MTTRQTRIVAIINVTPDSFSDGGEAMDADAALTAITRDLAHGADVIDIGAESTRPGATPVSPEEEWERLEPVLRGLEHLEHEGVPVSIDTRHAGTAAKALEYGVDWINDVSGFSSPDMVAAVKGSDCKLVMMHSLGVPPDRNVIIEDSDAVGALLAWAEARTRALEAAGIARSRIIFDPGIGFGKSSQQSWDIIRDIERFHALGLPVLVGHSRKSFLNAAPHARDAATLGVSRELMGHVDFLRVHDVAGHRWIMKELANNVRSA